MNITFTEESPLTLAFAREHAGKQVRAFIHTSFDNEIVEAEGKLTPFTGRSCFIGDTCLVQNRNVKRIILDIDS